MYNSAKRRNIKKNLQFDITVEWLQEKYTGYCELTGIEFQFANKGKSPIAPSLDRIDSSKGYTKDNVRIVCWGLNQAYSWWGSEAAERLSIASLKQKGYTIIPPK